MEREQQGVPRTECVVCMAACVSTVLLPCGHLCLCVNCAGAYQKNPKGVCCPLCRLPVDNMHRVFLPVEDPPPRPPAIKVGAPGSPTGSDSSTSAADASVQVSPSLRHADARLGESASAGALHPQPRVYQRSTPNASSRHVISRSSSSSAMVPEALNRAHFFTDPRLENDMIARPARSIVRPPTYAMATGGAVAAPSPSAPPADGDADAVVSVRGSPAETPDSFDFVLPGAFVPSINSNPAFSRTWDGALRVRSPAA